MDNPTTKKLITKGRHLVIDLETFSLGDNKASELIIKIEDWIDNSIEQLKLIGEDIDKIRVLDLKNPASFDLFFYDGIENKKTRKEYIDKIKYYILIILDELVENKTSQEKENIIYFNDKDVYTINNKTKKIFTLTPNTNRKTLLLLLMRSNEAISGTELLKIFTTYSLLNKEIKAINNILIKNIGLKDNLIIHIKSGGYQIDQIKYKVIEN
jgi:hypothetical protein